MRMRSAGIALWMVVAVVTSALATCVPGGMASEKASMPSCMSDGQLCVSSTGPTNCCAQVAPQLAVTKVDLKSPIRVVMHWLAPVRPVPVAWVLDSIINTGSPPNPTAPLGLPRYITFGTLLV